MGRLSVIVPTYNSASTLEACLQAVRASTLPDYELIVADCRSRDATRAIAQRYADRVLEVEGVPSSSAARNRGLAVAQGDVIVNVDSDVVISPDTLGRIAEVMSLHQDVDAVTGLLAKAHPRPGFFSQYKNLYMHYTFQRLPERVTFLYGSIHAIRRRAVRPYGALVRVADDLPLGQQLVAEGRRIAFVRELEVIHLKSYTGWSLIKNDFQIPHDWARIFLAYQGWRQVGRNGTGFAHARTEQLVSVVLAPSIVLMSLLALSSPSWVPWVAGLSVCWLLLNCRFVAFLAKEKGTAFGVLACAFTALDHLVMAAGIVFGLLHAAMFRSDPPTDVHTRPGSATSARAAI